MIDSTPNSSSDESAVARTVHPWVAAGQTTVGFGLLPDLEDWPSYLKLAHMAEDSGFDSFWVRDHPLKGYDCWTTLAALAATTTTIRLGSATSCVYFRSPALLARVAADVDRISKGRMVLGLGIGDDPEEFAALHIPWLRASERQQVLEETVHIVQGLWSEEPFTYRGEHFQLTDATGSPGPVQQPHIPLLIAGGGERGTLRQVAQYADMANFGPHEIAGSAFTIEDVRRKYEVLRRYCEEAGRPYDGILRSYIHLPILAETQAGADAKFEALPAEARAFFGPALYGSTPQETVAQFRDLVAAGVQYFVLMLWPGDLETFHLLGERVIPALQSSSGSARSGVYQAARRHWLPWGQWPD
jgi:alkanesulfonate monooxygenase SsuD/methylene tetrahydromethanopterin reductase-like flavin-dependent oxidoreductase (luciferase family)